MAKHIGIIAISAEGAALCYQTICKEAVTEMGKHVHPEITMHTFSLASHVECLEASDWHGLAQLMTQSAQKLIGAGADLLICPDNTNHLGYDEAAANVTAPWLHIASEVAHVAKRSQYKRVGILGTKFLMESDVYPNKLRALEIDYSIPAPPHREELNRIIFDELVCGEFTVKSRNYIRGVIGELKTAGCDAIVLGCTELPLIVKKNESPLPLLDSTRILAHAALRESLAGVQI